MEAIMADESKGTAEAVAAPDTDAQTYDQAFDAAAKEESAGASTAPKTGLKDAAEAGEEAAGTDDEPAAAADKPATPAAEAAKGTESPTPAAEKDDATKRVEKTQAAEKWQADLSKVQPKWREKVADPRFQA
jgi:hypothetical protein